MTAKKAVPYEQLKRRSLQDPAVKAAYNALQPAHQIARLSIEQGLTHAKTAQRATGN